MRPSSFTFFALSLSLLTLSTTFQFSTCSTKLIHDTCNKSSQSDPNVRYKFCTTSLQSAPDSHCADLRQLGSISIRLIRYNATNTRCHIKQLLEKENNNNKKLDPYVKQCLMDCLDLYSGAVVTLKHAMEDYRLKHYGDANIEVSAAMDASTTCEGGFKEKVGVVSPLTKRNNDTFELSAVALSIINMFH